MHIDDVLGEKRAALLTIAHRYGASNVRVFGSFARGEADDTSDLDLLVDLEPGRSLFDLGAMLEAMQTLLGIRVDIATERGLKERIRARVLQEAISL